MGSKEIVVFLLVLPGFRNVDGHPSDRVKIELCPAVIAGNFRRCLIGRQRKSDLKSRRNFLRPGHGYKNRMEVGAISVLGIAGPERVSVAPAGTGLVVLHGAEDV